MGDPTLQAKAAVIRRCVQRAREEHAAAADFRTDFTRQDAAILNVERACQGAIAMANRVVALRDLGVPATAGESFRALAAAGLISADLSEALRRMAGFQNVAVHACQELNLDIVERVIATGLDDLLAFADLVIDL